MDIKGKICVVTGAASGIGRALCMAFADAGAKQVVCVDLNGDGAAATAEAVGGAAYTVDVSNESQITEMIDSVERDIGPINLFWSNAGIAVGGGMDTPNAEWQRTWEINVMSHVWAARHLVPLMSARGGGYLLNTASAAGLLNQIGSASYGVSKHAAVGLAEWIAMTHGDEGIKVSVLCPQAVRTEMTRGHEDHVAAINGMMEPEPVAQICLDAIRDETFLILPHEEVRGYMKNKTDDYDRWIGGMRKLNRMFSDKKM
ncbi:SDR family NAD(P)-dependent oxidoreductase [Sulfitobacter sp. M57]|uniref:SDR family oxidoreductase n=1 Tax=unclassified Sulfitobacter TaxID=196795 RepID=UPI0023E27961|nr:MULTISPECIES: SDR family NAD(P)-dependent oxidoreductase [unclassified Sulfitobacter]MDF3416512.1 SDR family NAD(P)-dependent oxidoreductase [Sulfitobacter sp. KE5]MDF3423933.1 SDR family NAD(P)-dependent oxidoreductase [Sulfitobacter sp. KE43]MDF3435034.1 SDR family NAD(P)-dependent oxidoreductase [Sulfitobacter sp. KE42]MDF3460647.1 SDR family NAD(P)-dependent oxidoreductase [Sulfitobacter sp. S74]MDF3464601.1 SDR family NAD(P)-dependent oxidoreductase [Sulfitobacter sp. Ks18]